MKTEKNKTTSTPNIIDNKIEKSIPIIKVRYHRELCPTLKDIEFIPNGDFVDLRAAEDISLKAGEFAKVSLGVSIELPEGYWGQPVVRSSTFEKFGFIQTNSFGVVDESFKGDNDIWRLPILAIRDTEIKINDRICQFRIVKKQPFSIMEVDKLDNPDRNGFGSTGTN